MLKCNLPWFFKITVVFKGYIDKTKLKQFSLLISTNWLEKFITNSNASSQDAKSPLLFLTLCIVQNSSVCYIYSNNIMFPRKKLLQAVPQLWDLCMFLQSNFTFWYWKTNVKHKFECIYSLHHLTLLRKSNSIFHICMREGSQERKILIVILSLVFQNIFHHFRCTAQKKIIESF